MTLNTARLTLTPLATEHDNAIFELRRLPEIYVWIQVGRWSSVDQSTKWIQAALTNPTALNYIVTVDSTSPLYSLISENTTVPRLANGALMIGSLGVMREGEIGYLVHPAAWAKGVAPEALTAVIPAYFERYLTEEKLTGHVDSENVRSQRVLIRLGFREVARKPIEMAEQGSRTEIIFELGREDGLRLKESVDS